MPRFSKRVDGEEKPNRLSRLIHETRLAGRPILDLTESNPTRVGLPGDSRDLLEALRDPAAIRYEPHPAGVRETREAVAGYYASRGLNVSPHQIILTASTSEAYSYAFRLLTDPGDSILGPAPSYPLFEHLAKMDCVALGQYPLHYDAGWWLDTGSLEEAITPGTRAILVVNPNNPTGSYVKRREAGDIAAICRKHGLALVVDEVFADYELNTGDDAVKSFVEEDNLPVIVTSGLSKILCLPQMKLAWMVVAGPDFWRRAALDRLELIADTYLSVSTPVQLAACRWLARRREIQGPLLDRLRVNLAHLRAAIAGTALELLHVEGGWYAVLRLPRTESEEEWALALLREDRVLIQPGYFFDFPEEAYAVVSLITSEATFVDGIDRIVRRS